VSHVGAVSQTTAVVTSHNLPRGRHATLLGIAVSPKNASTLSPEILKSLDNHGVALPLRKGVPFVPGRSRFAQVFTKVAHSGPFSTEVTGQAGTTGKYEAQTRLLGDLNGDGVVNLADLALFPGTYLSRYGGARYNPNADANQNGEIGIGDAKALLHNLTPLTPKIPLQLVLNLAPADSIHYSGPHNSGGITFRKVVTIEGRTTPGSLVFFDSGLSDYTFRGGAVATDAQGRFSLTVTNKDGINQNEFLVLDPFGQQVIRAYPIYWLGFGKSEE
jgi:hypothetical protein